jgi:hypothetical protein
MGNLMIDVRTYYFDSIVDRGLIEINMHLLDCKPPEHVTKLRLSYQDNDTC